MKQLLEVIDLNTFYDDFHAVKDVSFILAEGEIGCLLGPSGCGKTTLLRTIAGFEDAASGIIRIQGRSVAGETFVAPEKRGVGMVFQDYALFPHLSVAKNVAFGLNGVSLSEQKRRVAELLSTVGLAGEGHKFPHELSGGQQQRVALARALAPEPTLLLLDEPFSNLDVALRESLSTEIRSILKARSITALMVTHNQNEAFAMADKVGVVFSGEMLQWAPPHAVYHRPASSVVAGFVGEGAFLQAVVAKENMLESCFGAFPADVARSRCQGDMVRLLVRPEEVNYNPLSDHQAVVLAATFRGPNILYTLQLGDGESLLALLPSTLRFSVGERIGVELCFGGIAF